MKRPLTALALVLMCASCGAAGSTGGQPSIGGPPETIQVPSPVNSTSARPSLSAGGKSQAPGGTVPPATGISWDDAARQAAIDVATRAMTDFARPRTEATRWANDFARWLTPQATADYSGVDPATIPASTVTGPAALAVDEANGYGVTATVATDIGPYRVQLLRTSQDAPWKVNRLTPPA